MRTKPADFWHTEGGINNQLNEWLQSQLIAQSLKNEGMGFMAQYLVHADHVTLHNSLIKYVIYTKEGHIRFYHEVVGKHKQYNS